MVLKSSFSLGLIVGFLASTAQANTMIEFSNRNQEAVETQFFTREGEPISAIPVQVTHDSAGNVVEITPVLNEVFVTPLTFSIGGNTTQGPTVSLGVIFATKYGTHEEGVLLEIAPGAGGFALGMGWASHHSPQPSSGCILLPCIDFPTTVAYKVSILQTWRVGSGRQATVLPPGQTYVGVEGEFRAFLAFSLGLFGKIVGDQPGFEWIPKVGLGIGF